MGLICGLCGSLIAYIFMNSARVATSPLTPETIAIIVFLSITNAMTFSAFFGSGIPLLLQKVGLDPAVAAGPFVTTLNDIISSVIYFLTSYALIDWLANSHSVVSLSEGLINNSSHLLCM